MVTNIGATIDDLYHVPENAKAELVNGEIVLMNPTGFWPGRAGGKIYASLEQHERRTSAGYAIPDNVAFLVNLPHRKSFSLDAAWYTGQPTGMKFINGPPDFAVEVRSENGYGRAAELAIAKKRHDYFAAGTLVYWDVDLLSEDVITCYRADNPDQPIVYQRGDMAEADPAVPGWSMPVDDLFW